MVYLLISAVLTDFLHITDMTWGRISHPSEMVKIGDTITVKVLSFDKDNEKISLGLKQLTDNPWEKAAESLKVGQKIKGKIASITDYGLFVEVMKGVEGLYTFLKFLGPIALMIFTTNSKLVKILKSCCFSG